MKITKTSTKRRIRRKVKKEDKDYITLGFINCRGLDIEKRDVIPRECKEWGIDVFGLAELHTLDEDGIIGDYRINGRGQLQEDEGYNGVGLMVKQNSGIEMYEAVELNKHAESLKVEGRIITHSITIGPRTIYITIVYNKPEGRNIDKRKKFYKELKRIGGIMKDKKAEWIIMGDFNAHIGILGEQVRSNGDMLLDWVIEYDLNIKNLDIEPIETWRQGLTRSTIDYIIMNDEAQEHYVSMTVDSEHKIGITTDHNALILRYKCKQKPVVEKQKWTSIWKRKGADWTRYRDAVELKLSSYNESCDIHDKYEFWEKTTIQAAMETVGKKKIKTNGRKKSKTWWNDEIKNSIECRQSLSKQHRRMCKSLDGIIHPTEEDLADVNRKFEEYKLQKKRVSKLIRDEKNKEETSKFNHWHELPPDERQTKLWKYMNHALKGEGTRQRIILKEQDEDFENEEDIVRIMETYWKKVFYEENNQNHNAGDYSIQSRATNVNEDPITLEELEAVLKKMKSRKAVDESNIMAEFIKHGGENMKKTLLDLFNNMIKEKWIPNQWNRSRISLIFKGKGKNRKDISSYRPVAIVSVMSKVLGAIVSNRLKIWAEENRKLGEEQSGFRKGRSTSDNAFVLQEILDDGRQKGKPTYMAFLDIEKAFDKISRSKLWERLEVLNVDEHLKDIIKCYYENTEIKLTLQGIETGWIKNNIGVRQGCTMSPILFNLFIEELLSRLRTSNCGIKIGYRQLSCLGFADDIVLVSETGDKLQEMLNIVSNYGKEWSVKFSPSKCKIMLFGNIQDEGWILENNVLEVVNEYKYLGFTVCNNQEDIFEKHKREKELGMLQMMGMIRSIAKKHVNMYKIVRELWKGIAIPRALYGYDICRVKNSESSRMDKIQNKVARMALGARKFVAIEALRGDMSWSLFKDRIPRLKANYKVKLLSMSINSWPGFLYRYRYNSKWKKEMRKHDNYYHLHDSYHKEESKKLIRERITDTAQRVWERGVQSKSTLALYSNKEKPCTEEFYDGSWGSSLLFAARSGSLNINATTRHWNGIGEVCQNCFAGERETLEHLLIECEGHALERQDYIENIVRVIGVLGWQELRESEEILTLLLGFKKDKTLVESTKRYLEMVMRKRTTS